MAMLVGRMGVANLHAAPKQQRKQLRMNRREAAAEADVAEEATFLESVQISQRFP